MIVGEDDAVSWLRSLPEWTDEAAARLKLLTSTLVDENRRQNLISASSISAIWQRHIADSAQLLLHVPRETSGPWLDLGTGAGFPGLVIAALRPECEVIMVESRPLRATWLELARSTLGLSNAKVVKARVELLDSAAMAVISARAFAPLDKLLRLSARFSTSDTLWLLPKGRSADQELQSLSGWNHMFHVEHSHTDPDAGIILGRLLGRKGRKL